LLAKVRGGVYDDVLLIAGKKEGRSETLVTRIGGSADAARASESRDSHGSARAENGDSEWRRRHDEEIAKWFDWQKPRLVRMKNQPPVLAFA